MLPQMCLMGLYRLRAGAVETQPEARQWRFQCSLKTLAIYAVQACPQRVYQALQEPVSEHEAFRSHVKQWCPEPEPDKDQVTLSAIHLAGELAARGSLRGCPLPAPPPCPMSARVRLISCSRPFQSSLLGVPTMQSDLGQPYAALSLKIVAALVMQHRR